MIVAGWFVGVLVWFRGAASRGITSFLLSHPQKPPGATLPSQSHQSYLQPPTTTTTNTPQNIHYRKKTGAAHTTHAHNLIRCIDFPNTPKTKTGAAALRGHGGPLLHHQGHRAPRSGVRPRRRLAGRRTFIFRFVYIYICMWV